MQDVVKNGRNVKVATAVLNCESQYWAEMDLFISNSVSQHVSCRCKSFTISPGPRFGQSGSQGSGHILRRSFFLMTWAWLWIPTPPRMAEFPLTQDDDWHFSGTLVLNRLIFHWYLWSVRSKALHFFYRLSPSLCFYNKLSQDKNKRLDMVAYFTYDLDSISYHFDFVCYKFWSKMCLLQ